MTGDRPGVVASVRVTHEYATVDEIAAAGGESQVADTDRLLGRPGVEEAFALHTCNRKEAYVVAPTPDRAASALDDFAPAARDGAVVRAGHESSLRHLLRVAAGLESVVLGEDQILGQVRTAYEDARHAGGVGPLLDDAVTKAIHVGERARDETAINEGHVSLGSAAAATVRDAIDIDDASALVVGAGEMGSVVASHLSPADLTIANRTVPHAEHLAASVDDADATGLDALPESVADADVVVTATGSDAPLLDDGIDAAAARDTLIVDIAQPRDVAQAVAEREGVDYVGLGAVEDVTDGTRERRAEAADTVERLVDREFDRLLDQFKRRRADEAIAAMHESADRLKRREVTTAITRLESAGDLTERQREVVESLGDALVGKLLAPPTTSLREAAVADDWDTIRTALDLFDPDFEDGGGPPDAIPAGAPADAVPDDIDADGPPEWVDAGEPPDD